MADLDAVGARAPPGDAAGLGREPVEPAAEGGRPREAAATLAHAGGAQLLVDNTFATPALQQPLALGADVVLHSTTKYLGGHSDVQGGALVLRARRRAASSGSRTLRHVLGAVASPFNSWLVLRGLRTLAVRVSAHCANALALAEAILPAIRRSRPCTIPASRRTRATTIARRQMRAFGGMLSFEVARRPRRRALAVASRVRLFTRATTLGGTESLIEHRASSEGPDSTDAARTCCASRSASSTRDDLIADLLQALEGPA